MTAGGKLFLAGVVVAAVGAAPLAATHNLPPSPASITTNPLVWILGAGLFVGLVGALAYVLEPSFSVKAGATVPYATVRTSLAMFLTALVLTTLLSLPLIAIPGQAAAGNPADPRLKPYILAYLVFASEVPIAFVVWLRIVKPHCLRWRELGLRRLSFEHLGLGVAGGLALFAAAGIVSALLSAAGLRQNQFERFEGVQGAPALAFGLAVFAGCIAAPFAEELFFRGYVFKSFEQRYGGVWAYLFSAGLFAVVHTNFA